MPRKLHTLNEVVDQHVLQHKNPPQERAERLAGQQEMSMKELGLKTGALVLIAGAVLLPRIKEERDVLRRAKDIEREKESNRRKSTGGGERRGERDRRDDGRRRSHAGGNGDRRRPEMPRRRSSRLERRDDYAGSKHAGRRDSGIDMRRGGPPDHRRGSVAEPRRTHGMDTRRSGGGDRSHRSRDTGGQPSRSGSDRTQEWVENGYEYIPPRS